MEIDKRSCQYRYSNLTACSAPLRRFSPSWMFWHLRRYGLSLTVKRIIAFARLKLHKPSIAQRKLTGRSKKSQYNEVLNLKPGELVEVKSENEILQTLDSRGRNRGLEFSPEMRRYYGKRFRVYKRLEKIILESTGESRLIRNTVLLQGVFCDGQDHFGCDRSCFHYWREAWLKRVEEPSS